MRRVVVSRSHRHRRGGVGRTGMTFVEKTISAPAFVRARATTKRKKTRTTHPRELSNVQLFFFSTRKFAPALNFPRFKKGRQETVRSRKRTSHVTVEQRDLGEKKKTISSLVGFFQLTSSALRARIKLLYLSQSSDSGMWRRKLFYGRCPTGANSMVSASPCLEIFNTDG